MYSIDLAQLMDKGTIISNIMRNTTILINMYQFDKGALIVGCGLKLGLFQTIFH